MQKFQSYEKSGVVDSGKREVRLTGQAVSRGVAVGRIVCLHGANRQFGRLHVKKSAVQEEVQRFRAAIHVAKRQLGHLNGSLDASSRSAASGVVEVHQLMLDDGILHKEIETEIAEKLINAEWAVKNITDAYAARYRIVPDENIRERYLDMEDVGQRILSALGGDATHGLGLDNETIFAARELWPSTLAGLNEHSPEALVTEHGGWTSHTFILARELNIPAVTGVRALLRRVKTGDNVVVDGYNGLLIIHPSAETLASLERSAQYVDRPRQASPSGVRPVKTLDGREITIRANLDLPSVYQNLERSGASGVGLYRSDFLFNQSTGFPVEAEQYKAYSELADFAGSDGANIRLFDLGIDQISGHAPNNRERNPALGLRAVRLGLTLRRHLRKQLRAILRASHGRSINIIVPMVSGIDEVRAIRALVDREKQRLNARGVETGTPGIGAMVEVPAAVTMIEELVEETDLICLGTNDLVQYVLAADRDNELVADWFKTLHPAVIRSIKRVLDVCRAHGKSSVVCGEMAASPFYVPALVGLGASDLSMNVNSIQRVKQIIAGIAYEDASELATKLLSCRTAEECEQNVRDQIESKWSHLFSSSSC